MHGHDLLTTDNSVHERNAQVKDTRTECDRENDAFSGGQ